MFEVLKMASQRTVVKAYRQPLFSMFYLRGLLCSAKVFYFAFVLLTAIFFIATCNPCSPDEVENQSAFGSCSPYRSNFDATSSDVVHGYFDSDLISKHSVQQHGHDKLCPTSDSFCFPSTLSGVLDDEVHEEDALDASEFQSEVLSFGLKQMRSTPRWFPPHVVFNLLNGRNISCSSYWRDDFYELLSSYSDGKNRQGTDASSCVRPLFDSKTDKSKLLSSELVKSGLMDSSSSPPVVLEPSILDWGHKNIYHPSVGFLTVKNVDRDTNLSVYKPYSSNSQFYPCNFSEMLLAPGEVASICFVFFPTQLGLSSAQLVLQTSLGGVLVQAKGFAVESPYLIKPLIGHDAPFSGRWRKNLSLFNPFDEILYVKGVTAWISTSAGNTSRAVEALCHAHTVKQSGDYHIFSAENWLKFGRDDVDLPEIAMRPHKNWELGAQTADIIMELDVSYQSEGKIAGAFCLQLLRTSNSEIDTIMVPLEAELTLNSDIVHVSAYLEGLTPCSGEGPALVALSVRNNAPYLLSIIKVSEVGVKSREIFTITFAGGLLLFPGTTTQVAILNHARDETPEVNAECKLHILTNDTTSSLIEIPCIDVITFCSRHEAVAYDGYTKWMNNIDSFSGRKKAFSSPMQTLSESRALDNREADEFVLRSWKSHATASFMSVLDMNELLFPMVQVGNYGSQWIVVRNPSQEPVVMQLILNSGEVIDKCRTPEMPLLPFSSSILLGNKSIAPTRYGFSIAKGAVTEAFIHPYGSASLGPILFQPSNRCEWRSSVLIRNNLSGVEWLSLRGLGGSVSLMLLEGSNPVQSLEFKSDLSAQFNYSSPDIVSSQIGKIQSCSQALTKEVYAKNIGDLPVEVIRIEVSGSECGLDGFLVHNCKGFSLQPGEPVKLHITYQSDFSAATIHRDLELALSTGILVIPMKASLPLYLLHFCKRSMFWSRLKKAMLMILFAAVLLFVLVCFLFPHLTAFASHDIKSGERSYPSVFHSLNFFHKQINWKSNAAISLKLNGLLRSVAKEETSFSNSATRCSNGHGAEDANLNPSVGNENQNHNLMDAPPDTKLVPSELSKASAFENSDMPDSSNLVNLRVKVGKDKGRRRKKKKNSSAGVVLFDVSSSQSGNSTPSSPLSPAAFTISRRPCPLSPGIEQSTKTMEPFTRVPDHHLDRSSQPSSKVSVVDNVVSLSRGNSCREKPNVTQKVTGRAILLPSATFPSGGRGRVVRPWTDQSPFLASSPTIAPHARAPGTKAHSQKAGGLEDKAGGEDKFTHSQKAGGLEDKTGGEDKFTYDIWGNHLFEPALNYPPKEVTSMSPSIENNSESFFVRGPHVLMTKSILKTLSSHLEDNE